MSLSEALCSAQLWRSKVRKLSADKQRQAKREHSEAQRLAEWNRREHARMRLPYKDTADDK